MLRCLAVGLKLFMPSYLQVRRAIKYAIDATLTLVKVEDNVLDKSAKLNRE
jgi:hypothetical protein